MKSSTSEINYEDKCNLDLDEIGEGRNIFEFVIVPVFLAFASGDPNEPVYFLKVEDKGEAKNEISDEYGHKILGGDLFLRGNYLQITRSRSSKLHKFKVLPGEVLVEASEVFEIFVDISDDLTLDKEEFRELVDRASI